jgi:mRNA interferase RelE/StbE
VTEYLVTFTASAKKELRDLPSEIIERLLPRELSSSPRPAGCKKLRGYKSQWRIRVGDYRIVYVIDDTSKGVDIRRIAHRKEAYET